MSRVVAGAAKGRRLAVPDGLSTRPTADRAREALFSALESMVGPLGGLRFLDLYAGSGAVGLEALSRGAAEVLLVESDRRAAAVVRANIDTVGLAGARLLESAVERVVAQPPSDGPYEVAFLDPPYPVPSAEVEGVLEALRGSGWLAADAVVVVERPTRRGELTWPAGFERVRERKYGEATLWYGRASGAERE